MIVGIGFDLVDVPRIEALLERWPVRFEARVFTDGERAYARARGRAAQHFAVRFAAKEAALKALGVPDGARWHEMEVVSPTAGGRPALALSGACAAAAAGLGVVRLHLSLTHADQVAGAVVVAEAA